MTCREKVAMKYSDWDEQELAQRLIADCPNEHLSIDDPVFCKGHYDPDACDKCWDREIPEIPEKTPAERMADRLKEVASSQTEEKVEPIIKDSGDRTRFESGAVRDMREGKGRCDLMPLEVISRCINYDTGDTILDMIRMFQIENDTRYLYEALEVFSIFAYGGSNRTMFLEVAKHFEEGAKKYGPDNWRKGIPAYCYIDSAIRHYLKYQRRDQDEPHDRAFVWNLLCCIWEVDYSPRAEEK